MAANENVSAVAQSNKRISPAERANIFAQTTRRHWQMMAGKSGAAGTTVKFDLDKIRLGARVRLMVEATLTAVHASSTSYTEKTFAPWPLLRRVSVDMNNGFAPFLVSGRDLYFYNMIMGNAALLDVATSGRGKNVMGLTAAADTGAANTIRFFCDLPFQLNERDPIGMLLLQNKETLVTISIDLGQRTDIVADASGYTFTLGNVTITPMVDTYSIPAVAEGFPDISILKLVQSTSEDIAGAGLKTIKLPPGTTYRKIALFIADSNGAGIADASFTGDFELVFNGADSPYRINPKMLAAINTEMYGKALPQGLYVFDFSYQGIPNYGGSRDYIDSERLTELWFRYYAPAAGSITAVYEVLSRLRGA